jgi:hypothetical protein
VDGAGHPGFLTAQLVLNKLNRTGMNPPNDNSNANCNPAAQNQNPTAQPANAAPVDSQNSKTQLSPGDFAAIARFPRNKISHLPPEVREAINQALRLRIPYHQILAHLGDYGKGLNKSSLSRWKKTGYPIWLNEQQKREDARAQLQLLLDVGRENDNGAIHEAAQQLATLKLCYALAETDLSALKQSFQQDPAAFIRLVHALPKLSQGGMTCEKVRLETAERKVKLEHDKIPPSRRVPTAEELQEYARQLRIM